MNLTGHHIFFCYIALQTHCFELCLSVYVHEMVSLCMCMYIIVTQSVHMPGFLFLFCAESESHTLIPTVSRILLVLCIYGRSNT